MGRLRRKLLVVVACLAGCLLLTWLALRKSNLGTPQELDSLSREQPREGVVEPNDRAGDLPVVEQAPESQTRAAAPIDVMVLDREARPIEAARLVWIPLTEGAEKSLRTWPELPSDLLLSFR